MTAAVDPWGTLTLDSSGFILFFALLAAGYILTHAVALLASALAVTGFLCALLYAAGAWLLSVLKKDDPPNVPSPAPPLPRKPGGRAGGPIVLPCTEAMPYQPDLVFDLSVWAQHQEWKTGEFPAIDWADQLAVLERESGNTWGAAS